MARSQNEALNSYITDMLSLEEHMQRAVRAQLSDVERDHPSFLSPMRKLETTIETHIDALKRLKDQRDAGQGLAEAVKRATSTVAGLGAAAIDSIRGEQLPKNLRDDYTALSHASVGYVMLHTTALAMSDQPVADLALRHLEDYVEMSSELQEVIPEAVVTMLQEEGVPATRDVLPKVSTNVQQVLNRRQAGQGSRAAGRATH